MALPTESRSFQQWKKGQSGNPSGRSKAAADVMSLARAKTKIAIETLAEITKDKKAAPSVRVAAASALLDRAWGRPAQNVSFGVAGGAERIEGAKIEFLMRLPTEDDDDIGLDQNQSYVQ